MDETGLHALREIEDLFRGQESLPAQKVRLWMRSPEPPIQSAVFDLLDGHRRRIEDVLSAEEIESFCVGYLERWLSAGREGGFPEGQYVAGHTLCRWFQQLWVDRQRNQCILEDLRDRLARLSHEQAELHDIIVTAILEHLFVDPEVVRFFASWVNDPTLSPLYEEARQLSGSSESPASTEAIA